MKKEKLEITLKNCPHHSYRLEGDAIKEFYEPALKQANELYLIFFERVYRKLMFDNFNPLWCRGETSDRIDPSDGFWNMNYFLFNISLLRILSNKFQLIVNDKTENAFDNEEYFFRFIKKEGITLKKQNTFNFTKKMKVVRNTMKKIIKNYIKSNSLTINEKGEKKKYRISNPKNDKVKIIYSFINPTTTVNIQAYIDWRYKGVLNELEKKGYEIILVSTKDFEESSEIRYKFINLNNLVKSKEDTQSLIKSLEIKRSLFLKSESILKKQHPEYDYFTNNIPVNFMEEITIKRGLENLFKNLGPGLFLQVGSLLNRRRSIFNYCARKYGVRSVSISGRILTTERLSNRIPKTHIRNEYSDVLPHSVLVFDSVSSQTIFEQSKGKIRIYRCRDKSISKYSKNLNKKMNTITLALQSKSDNMEKILDDVVSTSAKIGNLEVHIKMHPYFPIPKDLQNKYRQYSFVKILPITESLADAIEKSDLCITAYSTAAIEFAKKGKPIIWMSYITLNSLMYSEIQKRIGILINNKTEFENILGKLKHSLPFYQKHRDMSWLNANDLLFLGEKEDIFSMTQAIENEYSYLNN